MNGKKWIAASLAVGAIATLAVFAGPGPVQVFRTTAGMLALGQGSNSISGNPEYNFAVLDGSNLVALALGANPDSNQVFALEINCASSQADLIEFDKSNSNSTVIATSTSISTIVQQGIRSHFVNEERFVAQFAVQSVGNLAGGALTVAGRLHLGTNGCPATVLIAVDRDPDDGIFNDLDVSDTDQDGKIKDQERAGRGHFIGTLKVIDGTETNTVLVPLGHMTFRRTLDSNLPD
jgi:hypothetical protein